MLIANLLILVVKLQFSSVQFYLAKVNYNARIHKRILSWQGTQKKPDEKAYEGLAPQL